MKVLIIQVAAQLKTCGKYIALTERILYDLHTRAHTHTQVHTHTHYP